LPDFPNKNGPDDFAATKAIAAAANISVTAIAKRADVMKRFRLNECGVFMFVGFCGKNEFPQGSARTSRSLALHFCNAKQRFLVTGFNLSLMAVLLRGIRFA
jgi:hypothetical protein